MDPESLAPLPDGRQGLLLARGPGVMAGYYRDEAATAKVGSLASSCAQEGGWVRGGGVRQGRSRKGVPAALLVECRGDGRELRRHVV